eukprot:s1196_g2.t1
MTSGLADAGAKLYPELSSSLRFAVLFASHVHLHFKESALCLERCWEHHPMAGLPERTKDWSLLHGPSVKSLKKGLKITHIPLKNKQNLFQPLLSQQHLPCVLHGSWCLFAPPAAVHASSLVGCCAQGTQSQHVMDSGDQGPKQFKTLFFIPTS